MAKFYAVRKGRTPGIYSSWDECKAQVTGFKGAEYKKFASKEEADSFINNQKIKKDISVENIKEGEMIAYIDGSYNVKTKEFGYGMVLFTKEGKHTDFGKGENTEYSIHRNVAGEVLGALEVMKYALEKKYSTLYIHYDYAGIEYWATGEWKRNTALTKEYKRLYDEYKKSLDVHFIKVKAHTGDEFNEEADQLAKKSIF